MSEQNMVVCLCVKLLGIFQHLSGKKSFKITLDEPATVRDVVMKLTEAFSTDFKFALVDSQLNELRPNAIILVEGKEISVLKGLETQVKDSEEIVLVPIVHGG